MKDPRKITERLPGSVDWQSPVSAYCRCPGRAGHTTANGKKDCRVNVDGAPTIFCFHTSCVPVVAEANKRLRRELGAGHWRIVLPGGTILRSGDLLEKDGTVLKREQLPRQPYSAGSQLPVLRSLGEGGSTINSQLRIAAERFRPDLFEFFEWPEVQMFEDSPLRVAECEPDDQFRLWLKLWPAGSTPWIGDVYSSGKPEHRTHFRPLAEWHQIGPVMGNFTCGSSFKPGTYRRSNENLAGHRFLVVESDVLSKDQVGAIFAYLQRRLKFTLHCIVDTAGKSLHGWFEAPATRLREDRLKAGLEVFGCDPKLFTYSQPVRVPGSWRDGKLQNLLWIRN